MTSTPKIPAVTLAGDVAMPILGFGTWRLRGRTAYDAVRAALDVGYRHIDTATGYGNEAEVGRALRDSGLDRDDVFVTTKLPPEAAGRGRRTIAASLRDLGLEYVDLWLIHWPPGGAARPDAWREVLAARDDGLTRTAGVSNHSTAQIDELIDATAEPPAVNQIPWSPTEYDPGLLAEQRGHGVVVEGYSPLKRTDLDHPVLKEIAARYGVSTAQVVLRWHVDNQIVVIPKSARPERIRSNFEIFGFALTDEEVARIDRLSTLSG